MNEEKVDLVVIGAGVVGLAIAAELAAGKTLYSIALLERHDTFGRETSSRNSEVIHAGIYYPPGSLKARLSVHGKELLYDYCFRKSIPHLRCGKLIVANEKDEIASLDYLLAAANQNGVTDLEDLDAARVARLEPHIRAERALFSPSTGVIDSHALMAQLEQDALQNRVLIAYQHHVRQVEKINGSYCVYFTNPDGSSDSLDCDILINAAGLQSVGIASLLGIDPGETGYRTYPCKGEYFSLPPAKASLVGRLIYSPPLQELTGLGIHLTRTLDGRLRLGPNAIYVDEEDYSVDPAHGAIFYNAVKSFLPFIEPGDLEPEMAGIRPKLSGPGQEFRDFLIREESDRGLPGLINLIGIESPGLTCCLSIARLVRELI